MHASVASTNTDSVISMHGSDYLSTGMPCITSLPLRSEMIVFLCVHSRCSSSNFLLESSSILFRFLHECIYSKKIISVRVLISIIVLSKIWASGIGGTRTSAGVADLRCQCLYDIARKGHLICFNSNLNASFFSAFWCSLAFSTSCAA